jgi:hypothetical protein
MLEIIARIKSYLQFDVGVVLHQSDQSQTEFWDDRCHNLSLELWDTFGITEYPTQKTGDCF